MKLEFDAFFNFINSIFSGKQLPYLGDFLTNMQRHSKYVIAVAQFVYLVSKSVYTLPSKSVEAGTDFKKSQNQT